MTQAADARAGMRGGHELRRVIDEEREVEGLGEQELLDLYRSMVLLRTYDERSLVYHRQGRIGTYAMFWGHEAMQAGSAHALRDGDWVFPSYRESAIGLLRGIPAGTILHWWRGHPAGWWNPADHNVASIAVPVGSHVPHAAAPPAPARRPRRRAGGGDEGRSRGGDATGDRRGRGGAGAGRLAPLRARLRRSARVLRARSRRAARHPRGRARMSHVTDCCPGGSAS